MSDWDTFHAETVEWQALVGKAIVSFGEIELIALKCLSHISIDQVSHTAARLRFGQRVDLLVEILNGRRPLHSTFEEFIKTLLRAKELAGTRNLIAHNPVMMNIYEQMTTGDLTFQRAITSARNDRHCMDLEELKEFAAEVEDLASGLWLMLGKIIEAETGDKT